MAPPVPKKVGKSGGTTRPVAKGGKTPARTDKYGRSISEAEFKRREAYRSKIAGLSKKAAEAAREKEMKRRATYRTTKAVSQFGKREATKKDENLNVPKGIKVSAWEKMSAGEKKSARAASVKKYGPVVKKASAGRSPSRSSASSRSSVPARKSAASAPASKPASKPAAKQPSPAKRGSAAAAGYGKNGRTPSNLSNQPGKARGVGKTPSHLGNQPGRKVPGRAPSHLGNQPGSNRSNSPTAAQSAIETVGKWMGQAYQDWQNKPAISQKDIELEKKKAKARQDLQKQMQKGGYR